MDSSPIYPNGTSSLTLNGELALLNSTSINGGLTESSWALGLTIAVLTIISAFFSVAVLWLNLMQKRWFNYISLLAFAVTLGAIIEFANQIYTLNNFARIQQAQWEQAVEYFLSQTASGGTTMSDTWALFRSTDKIVDGLAMAQVYLANTQGLLFFYWSLILFASAWSISGGWWKNRYFIAATKVSCLILPAIQLVLTRFGVLQQTGWGFLIVVNFITLINIGVGSTFLILVLIRVMGMQRQVKKRGLVNQVRLRTSYDGWVEWTPEEDTPIAATSEAQALAGLDTLKGDAWLIARIALAFVLIEGLQAYVIAMEIMKIRQFDEFKHQFNAGQVQPMTSASEEVMLICSYIPNAVTGFLLFAVFGTTRQSIDIIKVVLRRWCCCGSRLQGHGDVEYSSSSRKGSDASFGSRVTLEKEEFVTSILPVPTGTNSTIKSSTSVYAQSVLLSPPPTLSTNSKFNLSSLQPGSPLLPASPPPVTSPVGATAVPRISIRKQRSIPTNPPTQQPTSRITAPQVLSPTSTPSTSTSPKPTKYLIPPPSPSAMTEVSTITSLTATTGAEPFRYDNPARFPFRRPNMPAVGAVGHGRQESSMTIPFMMRESQILELKPVGPLNLLGSERV